MQASTPAPATWTLDEVDQYLARSIAPVRTSLLYRCGLLLVALALVLLQACYVAMVLLAGYGTWLYLRAIPGILSAVGTNQFSLLLAVAPPVAGAVVTFFLLKPFLARPARRPKAFRATRSEQPVLFAFVDRLCDRLKSPRPSAIEFDLQVNASARLNGWLSLVRSDLTLTIGIPLASGLTLPQFSGVLAHEFGHFSQRAGLRLYFLIERIRRWFTRVAHERDRWDEWLDRARAERGWRLRIILALASAGVFLSRRTLQGLLFCAKVVSAWFSRQMEFNADRHEAELVGERVFAETMGRLPVLAAASQQVWGHLDRMLKARRLGDNFAVLLRATDAAIGREGRTRLVERVLQTKTSRWDTHPCDRDRIRMVRGVEGILPAADPVAAARLFSDFERLCRAVTRHHYEVTLGASLHPVTLVPAEEFAAEIGRGQIRAQALGSLFGALQQPARYFRLDQPGTAPATITVNLCGTDEAAGYRTVLEESLLRHAALAFMRGGGRVSPAPFRLSSAEYDTVVAEAADSRRGLAREIARLRETCSGQAQLLGLQQTPFAAAYRALSGEQEALLELRHRFVALDILRANLKHLGAARAANACDRCRRELQETSRAILANLGGCGSAVTPGRSLAEELFLFDSASAFQPEELAKRLLERADGVGAELLGELCTVVRPASHLASEAASC